MRSMSTLAIIAATTLVGRSIAAPSPEPSTIALKTLTYKGCFSSGNGLSKNSTYLYNSKGYCQTQCVPLDFAVQATHNSDECWCGDYLPPASDLVDNSKCDDPCSGIDAEMCGGVKYFSVYLTGTENSADNYDAAAASSSAASVAATATSAIAPSVVTVGGQTVTVQATSAAAASSSAAAAITEKKSSGPNKAGIAAGVVVGALAASAIAGGIFIWMRNRKRREVEEEYRRNAAVNNFAAGGKSPVSSGGASFTDTRLDPTLANRRMSDGSIADNQDYSRRILKVTNA